MGTVTRHSSVDTLNYFRFSSTNENQERHVGDTRQERSGRYAVWPPPFTDNYISFCQS